MCVKDWVRNLNQTEAKSRNRLCVRFNSAFSNGRKHEEISCSTAERKIQVPEPDPQTQKEEGCYTMFYKQEKPANNPWDCSAATALAVLLRQNSLGWSAQVLSCSQQFSSRSSLRINISNTPTPYHQLQKGLFVMGCKMSGWIKLRPMLTAPSCPQSAVQCGAKMMR